MKKILAAALLTTAHAAIAQPCPAGMSPTKFGNSTFGAVSANAYNQIDWNSTDAIIQAVKDGKAVPIAAGTVGCRANQDPYFIHGAMTVAVSGRSATLIVPDDGGWTADLK